MSSLRRQRRKSCEGKNRHESRQDAELHRWALYKSGECSKLNVYHCSFCGGWHVGHRPRKVKRER